MRLRAGDALPARDFRVTREALVAYARASGDHNPIHQDEAVAVAVGLPGVIAHGMFTMALMARAVEEWTDSAEVLEIGSKFTAPVVVPAGDGVIVTVAGIVKDVSDDRVTLALQVTCGEQKVLGMPRAVVRA